jgi:uncharacterized protein YegL
MGLLDEFTTSEARPLPVVLMLDTSGSMRADGKVEALSAGLADLVETLRDEDDGTGAIHIAIVTFGGDAAQVEVPLSRVAEVGDVPPLLAAGRTPMGGALDLVTSMLEDRDVIPSRAYRPTIALLSDGIPTDDWEPPMERLLNSERASKATRMALGIGADADRDCLIRFAGSVDGVRRVDEAIRIRDYLQFVSMSVVARSASQDPNAPVTVDAPMVPVWEDQRF